MCVKIKLRKDEALSVAQKVADRDNKRIRVYRCPDCHRFHLSSKFKAGRNMIFVFPASGNPLPWKR